MSPDSTFERSWSRSAPGRPCDRTWLPLSARGSLADPDAAAMIWAMETTRLFRPVGPKELDLIRESRWRSFPTRLDWQPIFYPVLTEDYATMIARDWNTKASGVGYVTAFDVDTAYLSQFDSHEVGGRDLEEYWIPAEQLEEFNSHIVGPIKVVSEWRGDPPVLVDPWYATYYTQPGTRQYRLDDQPPLGTLFSGTTFDPDEVLSGLRTAELEAERLAEFASARAGRTCRSRGLRVFTTPYMSYAELSLDGPEWRGGIDLELNGWWDDDDGRRQPSPPFEINAFLIIHCEERSCTEADGVHQMFELSLTAETPTEAIATLRKAIERCREEVERLPVEQLAGRMHLRGY